MRLFVFSFLIILICIIAPQSRAEIVACGTPEAATVSPDVEPYCNIHDRRFAYAEANKKFRTELDQRRENYAAPRTEAYRGYKERLLAGYEANDKAEQDAEKEKTASENNPDDNGDQEQGSTDQNIDLGAEMDFLE